MAALLSLDSPLLLVASNNGTELRHLEALSGIAGSVSLVSWIVLLLPQLIENYANGRADALSMGFICAWTVGDVANLIGALWGGLLPTVVAIAVYFCFADSVLLGQTLYYNRITANGKDMLAPSPVNGQSNSSNNDPTQPLLVSAAATRRRRSSSAVSRHRRDSLRRRDSLSAILIEDRSGRGYSPLFRNTLSVLGVVAAGTVGWGIAWWSGAWKSGDASQDMPLGAEILGYVSAALYLTARIPQIIRNHQKKSCEGLSLLFFLLSVLGNLTYGGSILLHSTEKTYVLGNLPWLMGSLGTLVQDAIVRIALLTG